MITLTKLRQSSVRRLRHHNETIILTSLLRDCYDVYRLLTSMMSHLRLYIFILSFQLRCGVLRTGIFAIIRIQSYNKNGSLYFHGHNQNCCILNILLSILNLEIDRKRQKLFPWQTPDRAIFVFIMFILFMAKIAIRQNLIRVQSNPQGPH